MKIFSPNIENLVRDKRKKFSLIIALFTLIMAVFSLCLSIAYINGYLMKDDFKIDGLQTIVGSIIFMIIALFSLILVIKNRIKPGVIIAIFTFQFLLIVFSFIFIGLINKLLYIITLTLAVNIISSVCLSVLVNKKILFVYSSVTVIHLLIIDALIDYIPVISVIGLIIIIIFSTITIYYFSSFQDYLLKTAKAKFETEKKFVKNLSKVNKELNSVLNEKTVLLREVHHRVKNNMQLISSLISLQEKYINVKDTQTLFKDTQDRIKTMALVHDIIYENKNLSIINFIDYLYMLSDFLKNEYTKKNDDIVFEVKSAKELKLDLDSTIPLGLIMNELIGNSLKYAFQNRKSGKISIDFVFDNDILSNIIFSDNGIGLDDNIDVFAGDSMGFLIINILCEQLQIKLNLNENKNGTCFNLELKEKSALNK